MVGRSDKDSERARVVTASARSLPALIRAGIGLCPSKARHRGQRGSACGQMKECAVGNSQRGLHSAWLVNKIEIELVVERGREVCALTMRDRPTAQRHPR